MQAVLAGEGGGKGKGGKGAPAERGGRVLYKGRDSCHLETGGGRLLVLVSCTKHVRYSEHGMYCQFEIILEQAMSATHIAVIPCTRTSPDEEEFPKN